MPTRTLTRIALWLAQGALAALFLFAGGFKLLTPAAQLARMAQMPVGFLQFIGACEVLGGLGLVLPGIFRVRLALTPLAAAGLVVIMVGAVVVTVQTVSVPAAGFPLLVGVLAAVVAIARRPAAWRLAWRTPRTAVTS